MPVANAQHPAINAHCRISAHKRISQIPENTRRVTQRQQCIPVFNYIFNIKPFKKLCESFYCIFYTYKNAAG